VNVEKKIRGERIGVAEKGLQPWQEKGRGGDLQKKNGYLGSSGKGKKKGEKKREGGGGPKGFLMKKINERGLKREG